MVLLVGIMTREWLRIWMATFLFFCFCDTHILYFKDYKRISSLWIHWKYLKWPNNWFRVSWTLVSVPIPLICLHYISPTLACKRQEKYHNKTSNSWTLLKIVNIDRFDLVILVKDCSDLRGVLSHWSICPTSCNTDREGRELKATTVVLPISILNGFVLLYLWR